MTRITDTDGFTYGPIDSDSTQVAAFFAEAAARLEETATRMEADLQRGQQYITDAIERHPTAVIDAINDEIRHFPLPLRGREHKGHPAVLAVHRVGLGSVGELYADGFWDNDGAIAYAKRGQRVEDAMSGIRITADELRALYGVVLERRAQRERDDAKGGSGLRRHR